MNLTPKKQKAPFSLPGHGLVEHLVLVVVVVQVDAEEILGLAMG